MSLNPISPVPQTPLTTQYDLRDAFQLLKKEIMLDLNCHAIGTVQSFQPAQQLATATLNYQRTFYKTNSVTQAYEPYILPYPLLVDCPVICLGGGTTVLTFPIQAGDECLILFNDRNMDNWFSGNSGGAVSTARLHSYSDALILVGLRSVAHVLSSYSTTHAVLRNNAGVNVGVNATNPTALVGNGTTTLGTILKNLITAIETATYGSNPIDNTTALEAVRVLVNGLLE